MKTFATLTVLALLTGCAHQDEWTRTNTTLELTYQAAVIIDAVQTQKIHKRPGLQEQGPLAKHVIGLQPSTRDTWLWAISSGLSHYLIARALPESWRGWYQSGTAVYRTRTVLNNDNIIEEWKERRAAGEWADCSYPEC